jgi:hypothetical protein
LKGERRGKGQAVIGAENDNGIKGSVAYGREVVKRKCERNDGERRGSIQTAIMAPQFRNRG